MGIIKSNFAPAAMSPFSMRDIEQQAAKILHRARRQAEQLLAEAQKEAEEFKRVAHQQGQNEGRRQGLSQGAEEGREMGHRQALEEYRQEFSQVIQTLGGVMTEINSARRQMEGSAVREVVELAVAIARRVTKRQAQIDPAVLEANIAEAMKRVIHCADVRIAVHPDQKRLLMESLPRLKMQWPHLDHIELIEDPALAPGGCRIFTAHGQIDADLTGQLDRIVGDLMPDAKKDVSPQ